MTNSIDNCTANFISLPGLGNLPINTDLHLLHSTSDSKFTTGQNGVRTIIATGDGKVEFVAFEEHTLAFVGSALGYPAYYPVHPVKMEKPLTAVLMDLDGTSVRSEEFWVWIIQIGRSHV